MPSEAAEEDLKSCVIPVHLYSILFICDTCRWWCVRERWEDAEINHDCDYLITGVTADSTSSDDDVYEENAKPWLKALTDPHIYQHASGLPYSLGQLFAPAIIPQDDFKTKHKVPIHNVKVPGFLVRLFEWLFVRPFLYILDLLSHFWPKNFS